MDGTVLLVYSSDPLSVCGFAIDGWYGLGKNKKKRKKKHVMFELYIRPYRENQIRRVL